MQRPAFPTRFIPPAILAVSLVVVYLFTLAPGLTWANEGADGGDLIAAAASGGVAHPTGYPLYLLLARLFQMIPVGSLAYRTNLMSALAAVSASLLVYLLVIRSPSPSHGSRIGLAGLAGLASAYAFGLSPLIWSQAVITEVHALHACFTAALLFLAGDHSSLDIVQKRKDGWLGLVFGLSLGHHLTTLLFLPILLHSARIKPNPADALGPARYFRLDLRSLARRFSWMGAGLSIYLTLPLRALSRPPVNWGNPAALDGFLWLVSGRLYQDELFRLSAVALWDRIQAFTGLLLGQFGHFGLVVGLIGLIVYYSPTRLYHDTIWVFSAVSIFAIGYAAEDSFMYLIPAFLCYSVWIGLGLKGLMDKAARRYPKLGTAMGVLVIFYFLILAAGRWRQVDASHDLRAEQFGRVVLEQAPESAIVFAKGDRAVFTMWYFHYALDDRPDIAVLATDLLPHRWYQDTLRHTYPDLKLPALFPYPEVVVESNPGREICYIEYDLSAQIRCGE